MIAVVAFILYGMFNDVKANDQEGELIVVLGQTFSLDKKVRACWTEENATISLEAIEKIPYAKWSDIFDRLNNGNSNRYCGKGIVTLTFVELVGNEYTDSDGDVWKIVKSIPHSKTVTAQFIYLITMNRVMTQEEYDQYIIKSSWQET